MLVAMRAVVGAVLAAALLVWAAPAQAYDFGKEWGYAVVDDKPFTDPGTGALLPATQVFPRGRIKDKDAQDCCNVALTVTVARCGGTLLAELPAHLAELNHIPFRIDRIANCHTVE